MASQHFDTHVAFVLDSSGSMAEIEDDTKGGYNSFLQNQREEDGECTVSLYEFDTEVRPIYQVNPIEDAPELTSDNYTPGGQTALHDAIAWAIEDSANHLDTLSEADRPDNVIVVVLTDGKENASETPEDTVRERVTSKRDEGWEFLFIGADQDAALTAQKKGIDPQSSRDIARSSAGVQNAYNDISNSVSRARQQGETDGFTDEVDS